MMAYMLMTSLMGFIDSLMLSNKGETALAALGIGSSMLLLLFSPTIAFIEISQLYAARSVSKSRNIQNSLFNSFLIISITLGFIIVLLAKFIVPILIHLFNQSQEVNIKIYEYVNVRMYEVIFAGIVYVSEGFWNGLNKPQYNLKTFGLMQLLNIMINYVLIYGNLGFPEFGIRGAAYSSVISVATGSLIFIYLADFKYFSGNKIKFYKKLFKQIAAKLIPRIFGGVSLVLSYVLLYIIIGQLGTTAVAVSNILIGFYVIFSTLIFAFGKTATTFVGQALSTKKEIQANYWGWKTAIISFIFFLFAGITLFIFSNLIAKQLFPGNLAAQELFVRLFDLYAFIIPLESIGITLSQALMGFGRVGIVTFVLAATEWCFAIPFAWFFGIYLGYDLTGIWLIYVCKWLIESLLFFIIWKKSVYKINIKYRITEYA